MLNELLEYKAYTSDLLSEDENKWRLGHRIARTEGLTFSRQLTIIARRFLFHNEDLSRFDFASLRPKERSERVKFTYDALAAWSSINLDYVKRFVTEFLQEYSENLPRGDREKLRALTPDTKYKCTKTQQLADEYLKLVELETNYFKFDGENRDVFFVDENNTYPSLIDTNGNGRFVAYLLSLFARDSLNTKDPGLALSRHKNTIRKLHEWARNISAFHLNIYKGDFRQLLNLDAVTFEDTINEAINYGPLRNYAFYIKNENIPALCKMLKSSKSNKTAYYSHALYFGAYIKMQQQLFNKDFIPLRNVDLQAWLGNTKLFGNDRADHIQRLYELSVDDAENTVFFTRRVDQKTKISNIISCYFHPKFLSLFTMEVSDDINFKLPSEKALLVLNDDYFINPQKHKEIIDVLKDYC